MATRDDGYEELRAATLATVRDAYRALREEIGFAHLIATAEGVSTPAAGFVLIARTLRETAFHHASRRPLAESAAARAVTLELLAGFARAASLTWAEVRS